MKDDPSNLPMMELFRVEAEHQTGLLTSGLLELEKVARPACVAEAGGSTKDSETPAGRRPGEYSPARSGAEATATQAGQAALLESLMRAAHSLKGAARIVNLPSAVRVAHVMEDCFVAAQEGQLELRRPHIDLLLRGVDLLANISKHAGENAETPKPAGESPELEKAEHHAKIEEFVSAVAQLRPTQVSPSPAFAPLTAAGLEGSEGVSGLVLSPQKPPSAQFDPAGEGGLGGEGHKTTGLTTSAQAEGETHEEKGETKSKKTQTPGESRDVNRETRLRTIPSQTPYPLPATLDPKVALEARTSAHDRVLRLTAENLNRLLGLAGESLVESRWLRPFTESMQRLKRMHSDLERTLDRVKQKAETEKAQWERAELLKASSIWPSPPSKPPSSPMELKEREVEGGEGHTTTFPISEFLQPLSEFQLLLREAGQFLGDRLQELDLYDRRSAHLSNRLYLEVLRTRMRPFGDGTRRFPRMVRDLARSLGKQARLEIEGENTQVDRDILDRLETPLAHLLRNALDHGCEMPEERERAGKPPEATIRVEARHSAGMLLVTVSDDGAGLDMGRLRRVIAQKQLTTPSLAERMNEAELLQFLFLPGFSLRETVTELSGRGVGLDIVQNMVRSVRGNVRVSTQPGRGMKFQLQLPLTMSVLRTLLVEVGGEPYAFPLAQIAQTLRLPRENLEALEGRQHFKLGDQPVGLLAASQILCPLPPHVASPEAHGMREDAWRGERATPAPMFGLEKVESRKPMAHTTRESRLESRAPNESWTLDLRSAPAVSALPPALPIVVVGDHRARYGLLVDRFLGERELVVQPLDPRLGKVKDISAAALMEDGAPVLIVDVDDLVRSIEKLISSGMVERIESRMQNAEAGGAFPFSRSPLSAGPRKKRILAVDDSLTVRELARKLLTSHGYLADVAVDGMEGWNAVRSQAYDLVITDVDMPRLDGIELATLIKRDAQLKSLPVMIVSYKDRQQDRLRGLEAGADYYLAKASFSDDTLLQAVQDLIGDPEA